MVRACHCGSKLVKLVMALIVNIVTNSTYHESGHAIVRIRNGDIVLSQPASYTFKSKRAGHSEYELQQKKSVSSTNQSLLSSM